MKVHAKLLPLRALLATGLTVLCASPQQRAPTHRSR